MRNKNTHTVTLKKKIDILSDASNIGILLYCEGGYIQFDFNDSFNIKMISRFNDESKKMFYYELEEITQSEMITYVSMANKSLTLANNENDIRKIEKLLCQNRIQRGRICC